MTNLTTPQLIVAGTLILGVVAAGLALKAWLLVTVLGWFGVHILGFWQAVVVVILAGLLVGGAAAQK